MMKVLLLLSSALAAAGATPPTPSTVFLKPGFSSILEFDAAPVRLVLGDTHSFQVERLGRSLVLRTLSQNAVSNLFVYFASEDPKLFVLTASEDANPTFYKAFESPAAPRNQEKEKALGPRVQSSTRGARIRSARFVGKKDYLTVDAELSAGSDAGLKPLWAHVRLTDGGTSFMPSKLWAERQEVQKDSQVKARFVFIRPGISRNLKGASLIVPLQGGEELNLPLGSSK